MTPAYPYGIDRILFDGTAYDSYKYVFSDGHEEYLYIFQQQNLYEKAVDSLIEDREFDIIHAHDWITFRAGLRAKQRTGLPLIVHVHSIESDRAAGAPQVTRLSIEIEYLGFTMADRIIAVSKRTKDAIVREYAIPANKIKIVHNSIDHAEMTPLDTDNAYRYLSGYENPRLQSCH